MAKMKIAVQLYTLRDAAGKDLPKVLQQVRKIGYTAVELAGMGNLKTPQDVKKAMDDAGVVACGAHVGIDGLLASPEKSLDDQKVMGVPNVIVPFINDTWRSVDGYKRLAGELTKLSDLAAQRGQSVGYHNHAFEFEKYDGKTGMDLLWSSTDPAKVRAELDVYWVRFADVDPAAYIEQLGKRVSILHLKDMNRADKKKFAPVGSGVLDFAAILDAGKRQGVQWGVVEQDNCYEQDPLDSIRESYEYLRSIKAV